MGLARSTGSFLGTDETTGVTIANNASSAGSEVDVLGDNASAGDVNLYIRFTSTVTVGSLDVTVNRNRVTGGAYSQPSAQFSVTPINGTGKYYLGRVPAARFMLVSVLNNATGASATNVSILYELFKLS